MTSSELEKKFQWQLRKILHL